MKLLRVSATFITHFHDDGAQTVQPLFTQQLQSNADTYDISRR
jgi:hypothetical protein